MFRLPHSKALTSTRRRKQYQLPPLTCNGCNSAASDSSAMCLHRTIQRQRFLPPSPSCDSRKDKKTMRGARKPTELSIKRFKYIIFIGIFDFAFFFALRFRN
ncbi:unnamed protein product [Lactuca virosa]|uniref:Uncharacterized protein n=1 Tax=Lactuca virosa TaxID=75947 RepID=A0AAU9N9N2_9ASTR|nr:unnamed protein product [Lactuca virosa]